MGSIGGLQNLGCRDTTPIMVNEMKKNMEHNKETTVRAAPRTALS